MYSSRTTIYWLLNKDNKDVKRTRADFLNAFSSLQTSTKELQKAIGDYSELFVDGNLMAELDWMCGQLEVNTNITNQHILRY